jgi:hypothetical protein
MTEREELNHLPVADLVVEVMILRSAIRRHRDYRGDDRCHLDDGELYAVLPEGDTRPAKDTEVNIENCWKFITCRQQGREYVSPQRRIEELEAALREVIRLAPMIPRNAADLGGMIIRTAEEGLK